MIRKNIMRAFLRYLVERFKDKNAWVRITIILSLFGYHFIEIELESILTISTGVSGIIMIFLPEK